mgnify:CR=1 FL=1
MVAGDVFLQDGKEARRWFDGVYASLWPGADCGNKGGTSDVCSDIYHGATWLHKFLDNDSIGITIEVVGKEYVRQHRLSKVELGSLVEREREVGGEGRVGDGVRQYSLRGVERAVAGKYFDNLFDFHVGTVVKDMPRWCE